jgi:hypothetical protein
MCIGSRKRFYRNNIRAEKKLETVPVKNMEQNDTTPSKRVRIEPKNNDKHVIDEPIYLFQTKVDNTFMDKCDMMGKEYRQECTSMS